MLGSTINDSQSDMTIKLKNVYVLLSTSNLSENFRVASDISAQYILKIQTSSFKIADFVLSALRIF